MQTGNQELHVGPASPGEAARRAGAPEPALRVPFEPSILTKGAEDRLVLAEAPPTAEAAGVRIEPFVNPARQLRLLARFPEGAAPRVNGEPAPRLAVLAPGDIFRWAGGGSFRLALYVRPAVGLTPGAVIGKSCPVCRMPLAAGSTCYTCICGVAMHCERDSEAGLSCAPLSRECPVCRRPIVLAEGYIDPPVHED
ncbi:MAG: hypothetical protein KA118_11020 [Verrucomicrobia bacterium]|nr:hypothetical protein [Verrucomicrobiota bacterium]